MRILWVSALVVLVDQLTKLLVYFNMYRTQSIPLLGDWLKLTYTENPGMAFGIDFGPRGMVTIFSMLATALIVLYMWSVRGGYRPYMMSLSLILGGALGNIIDRVFYGVIFDYAPLFMGRVIDFIHVDVWRGTLQDVIPFLGGDDIYFALFPIWNVSDMAIVCGVVGILFFQKEFHNRRVSQPADGAPAPTTTDGTAESAAITPADSLADGSVYPTTPVSGRPAEQ